jgi:DNA-binding NtrC family response regulator
MPTDKRLLIVDDDKIHRVIYSSIAAKMNYQVDHADSPAAADAALRAADYDAVILDLVLGEDTGLDVLALMSGLALKPKVVLVTGASDATIEETFATGRAFGLEMFGPVRKPVNVMLIRTVLKNLEIAGVRAPQVA